MFLIDFGLSKQYDQNGEPESSTTLGLGTPGYAPIEQANYKHDGSFPATLDIYALGASIYKMLIVTTPPRASDILSDGFPDILFVERRISEATIAIVKKAMSPIKEQRYNTVSELLEDIDSKKSHANSSKNGGCSSCSGYLCCYICRQSSDGIYWCDGAEGISLSAASYEEDQQSSLWGGDPS